jgi:hypothetical protein
MPQTDKPPRGVELVRPGSLPSSATSSACCNPENRWFRSALDHPFARTIFNPSQLALLSVITILKIPSARLQ